MLHYMLDTDIVIYTMKARPDHLRKTFNARAPQLCLSTITLAELMYGAQRSSQPDTNLETIEGFCARLEVLEFDANAAWHAGQIRAELARNGTPIGPFDEQIAGHARAHGFILVTNNLRHFQQVPGLRVENWIDPNRTE